MLSGIEIFNFFFSDHLKWELLKLCPRGYQTSIIHFLESSVSLMVKELFQENSYTTAQN